jgi:hypothetical protein
VGGLRLNFPMMRLTTFSSVLLVLGCLSSPVRAQDSKAAIQQKLLAKYALTKPTAKQDDIVTAGSVLVLKKDKLTMAPVGDHDYYQNKYQNGSIKNSDPGKFGRMGLGYIPGASKVMGGEPRTFVSGEKIWVTGIAATDKGIVFSLFTDAFSDVRYKATLLFPLPKDGAESADQVEKTVAEVFDIQPADDAKAKDQPQQQQPPTPTPQPAPAPVTPAVEAPPAPIAPPPPPPDAPPVQPPTVEIGQTTDQVVAVFGQPQKVIKLATKQIYVYKDMKVTFIKGKVTDVQ